MATSNNIKNIYSGFLDYKRWDVYMIKVQEEIFGITEIEPRIYYRMTDFLNYVLKIKALITATNVYIKNNLEEISKITNIIEYLTKKESLLKIQKEVNILTKEPNKIFIYGKEYQQKVKQVVDIFEKVITNLSQQEILPKPKKDKSSKITQDLDPEDREYIEFVKYLEGESDTY